MKSEVKHNLTGLNNFVKGLSKKYYVKIGVLGKDASREGENFEVDNAAIGAVHEFGSFSGNIPKRSFLRMPLFMKTSEILESVRKHSQIALGTGNFRQVLVNLGIACENVIDKAFETSGFGTWPKLKNKTIKKKIGKNPMPLVNTEQLRRFIISQVEEII